MDRGGPGLSTRTTLVFFFTLPLLPLTVRMIVVCVSPLALFTMSLASSTVSTVPSGLYWSPARYQWPSRGEYCQSLPHSMYETWGGRRLSTRLTWSRGAAQSSCALGSTVSCPPPSWGPEGSASEAVVCTVVTDPSASSSSAPGKSRMLPPTSPPWVIVALPAVTSKSAPGTVCKVSMCVSWVALSVTNADWPWSRFRPWIWVSCRKLATATPAMTSSCPPKERLLIVVGAVTTTS